MNDSVRDSPAVAEPLVRLDDLVVVLGRGSAARRVLDRVNLRIERGTTTGLVGESGSGKSTLARTLVGLHRPASGQIVLGGASAGSRRAGLPIRVQLVPQNPYSSLDPRRTVGQTIAEALDPRRARVGPARGRIGELLTQVSLDPATAERYPHQLSGGQRQRIAVARALAAEPQLLIADEITSALDLTTQAEILNLLADLRRTLSLTMLFISHDLAVVRHVSDHVAVLLHGQLVEHGPARRVFEHPSHSYTRKLLDSVPGGRGFLLDDAPDPDRLGCGSVADKRASGGVRSD